MRHLREKHDIEIKEDLPKSSASSLIFSTINTAIRNTAGTAAASIVIKDYKAFISTINTTRFRKALVIFIIICSIAFYVFKSEYFKELLLAYSAGVFKPFLVHVSNTVKRWILKKFKKRKLEVKDELATARSRIYISFNL